MSEPTEQTPAAPVAVDDERGGVVSASKFDTIVNCPGQPQFLELVGDRAVRSEADDELAERGVKIHAARETGNTLNFDPDEAAAYKKACAMEVETLNLWKETNGIVDFVEQPHEQRLWMVDETFKPCLSAKLDVYYVGKDADGNTHVLITDWKSGTGIYVKRVRLNWQMKIQSELAQREHDAASVTAALIFFESYPPRVDLHTWTQQALVDITIEILDKIDATKDPFAERHAGRWCRFCPARALCPENITQTMLPSAIALRNAEAASPEKLSKEEIKDLVLKMAPEDMAYVWRRSTMIDNTLDEIKARLKTLGDAPLATLGIKLTPGQNRKSIPGANTKKAIEHAVDSKIVTEEDAWAMMTVNLTALSEKVQTERKLSKEKAAEFVAEKLRDFIVTSRGEPILREKKD
jgi:hypothetical protein